MYHLEWFFLYKCVHGYNSHESWSSSHGIIDMLQAHTQEPPSPSRKCSPSPQCTQRVQSSGGEGIIALGSPQRALLEQLGSIQAPHSSVHPVFINVQALSAPSLLLGSSPALLIFLPALQVFLILLFLPPWPQTRSTKIKGEEVIELGAGSSQIDFVCKDASGTALKKEEDICTQRMAEKGIRALAVRRRRVWDAHDGARRTGRQEGRLEKGPLDLFQVRLPELQVTTGDEGSSDGIVKNIFDSELGNNARLIVGNPEFLCHLVASLRGKDVCWFDGSAGQDERMMTQLSMSYLQGFSYQFMITDHWLENPTGISHWKPQWFMFYLNFSVNVWQRRQLTWLGVVVRG